MVVSSLAKFDHLRALSDTSGRTATRRAATFIAHPVDRIVVAAFRREQVSLVPQAEPTATIFDELQILFVPNTSVHPGKY